MARAFLLTLLLAGGAAADAGVRARYVMGTILTLHLEGRDADLLDRTAEGLFGEVERWDRLLSTYKPDSAVSLLNGAAPAEVTVSTGVSAMIAAALSWSRRTGGAFDPTVGPLVKAWGFHTPSPRVPAERDLADALARVGAARVEVAEGRARLAVAGMSLDFGGIGKGWALDRALESVDKEGLEEARLDFGGQWLFWSRDPRKRWASAVSGRVGEFSVPAGSLSTSSQDEKYFVVSGPPFPRHAPGGGGARSQRPGLGYRFGHILDPRTGWPVEGVKSVTVWAARAEDADALSTALFVMGPRDGAAWAEKEGVAALFMDEGGRETATPAWIKIVEEK